jgi:hypothetical protein
LIIGSGPGKLKRGNRMTRAKFAKLTEALESAGFEVVSFKEELNRDLYPDKLNPYNSDDSVLKLKLNNGGTGKVILELKEAKHDVSQSA